MIIRNFVADTREDAYQMARRALGPDAIILSTTTRRTGNFLTRWFHAPQVEVIAGKPRPRPDAMRVSGVFRAPAGSGTPVPADRPPSSYPARPASAPPPSRPDMPAAIPAAPPPPESPAAGVASATPPAEAPMAGPPAAAAAAPEAAPEGSAPSDEKGAAATPPAASAEEPAAGAMAAAVPVAPAAAPAVTGGLADDVRALKAQVAELGELKSLLEKVLGNSAEVAPAPEGVAAKAVAAIETMEPPVPELPAAMRGFLDGLQRSHLDGAIRHRLKKALLERLEGEDRSRATRIYEEALGFLAEQLKVGRGLEALLEDRPNPVVVALVGPTGVGKTTTLAKLAAMVQFQHGRRAAFVTLDTYRIGAPEQLKQYAEIIDIPIKVAFKPEDLRQAVDSFSDRDVVLVDTVGRSHRNKEDIEDLRRYFEGMPEATLLMALSANTKYHDLKEAYEVFKDLGAEGLVVTKLDETSSYGDMVNLLLRSQVPAHFVTTGQSVPDDIQPAKAVELARLVTPTPPSAARKRPVRRRKSEDELPEKAAEDVAMPPVLPPGLDEGDEALAPAV